MNPSRGRDNRALKHRHWSWAPAALLAVLALLVLIAAPAAHALSGDHHAHDCQACEAILTGALLLPTVVTVAACVVQARAVRAPQPVSRSLDFPRTYLPRAPPQ